MSAATGQPVAALPGSQFPLGSDAVDGGTNFAVPSAVADGMVLCRRPTDTGPPGPTIRLAACGAIRRSYCRIPMRGRSADRSCSGLTCSATPPTTRMRRARRIPPPVSRGAWGS